MLKSLMEEVIRQDLLLSSMRAVDTGRYIVSSWNRTHPEPMDENAVAFFLCDENQGGLTDEQKAFARERRGEMSACYERVVFRILLWGEMTRLGVVPSMEEYRAGAEPAGDPRPHCPRGLRSQRQQQVRRHY